MMSALLQFDAFHIQGDSIRAQGEIAGGSPRLAQALGPGPATPFPKGGRFPTGGPRAHRALCHAVHVAAT